MMGLFSFFPDILADKKDSIDYSYSKSSEHYLRLPHRYQLCQMWWNQLLLAALIYLEHDQIQTYHDLLLTAMCPAI